MSNLDDAAAFLDFLRVKRGASHNTLARYQQVIAAFDRWGKGRPFAAMTELDVEEFTSTRPRRGGVVPAPATVALETAALGSLYRWGQARRGWSDNPAALAVRPRVHNQQPNPVDDKLWMSFWTTLGLPDEARVLLGLGYYCGLRREELTTLTGDDFRNRMIVNFRRKGGGTDTFDYGDVLDHWRVTMPAFQPERLEAPLKWLARIRGPRLLVPWADTWTRPNSLNKRLTGWLEGAGLEPDAFTPHQTRHSFATNLLRTGVSLDVACALCNHSSPTITMRYIRTAGGRLRALRENGVRVVGIAGS